LPSLYYICRASISTRKKLYTLASYAASLIVILLVLSFGESIYFDIINFSPSEFFLAFNALGFALRYDLIIVLSLLPLTLGLFFKFRKENSKKADSILVLILTALLAGPVVSMLTDFYSVMPYRFLPLIVFVAVGIGVLLSRKN
tara:strand:- start:685 stop:1116 length:432 start_codon:yes stop_codon:yes gene_type:complete